MTDSSTFDPHTAQPFAGSVFKAPFPGDLANAQPDEPEDYTIKCICGYEEDDGNTVYCDKCDTWQHTECYYIDEHGIVPSNKDLEEYSHECADCQPRPLDKRGAIERQRNRRNEPTLGDRKVKKPASKSHKKKIRASETNGLLTNGWSHGADSDPQDRPPRNPRDSQPPSKKSKSNHRFSNSTNLSLFTHNSTSNPHKRSGSAVHSPSKPYGKPSAGAFAKEPYSSEFIHLYDDDPGETAMQTNLYSDIDITRDLMNWSCDVEELEKATNGSTPQDVFVRYNQPVASMTLPHLTKVLTEDGGTTIHGQHPSWKYLTIDSFTPKDSIVAELKGKIGHMQRYSHDPVNRWDYLRHPVPFVFFHPKLPIYIDTRSEGTICRYLRRSCTPNLTMQTSLENNSEYHFCFVAKHDLDPGSELTIGWTLDEHLRNHFASQKQENIKKEGDPGLDYIIDWVGKVLPEFGGCACTSPSTCGLAKYDRRSDFNVKGSNGYRWKHSPADTRDGTTSRADSEQDDSGSSSGSKSRSRDLTPTNGHSGDSMLGAGMEISDREKRKIAALERNFEQLENDKHQPPHKKKKRNSGGSTTNTPPARTTKSNGPNGLSNSQPNTPGLSYRAHYVDASTSRRIAVSPTAKPGTSAEKTHTTTVFGSKKRSSQPNTPLVPSPLNRQTYVSSSMQTEPEEEDTWYKPLSSSKNPPKKYMSLTKRLLLRSQQDRARIEERQRTSRESNDTDMTNAYLKIENASSTSPQINQDTAMGESDQGQPPALLPTSIDIAIYGPRVPDPPTSGDNSLTSREIKPPPPWMPTENNRAVNGYRANDLRVQLPSQPSMPSDSSLNTPLVETPSSGIAHSPSLQPTAPIFPLHPPPAASNAVQPSPIKKVSLSDYISRRKGSQPASESATSRSPILHQGVLKPPSGTNNELGMRSSVITESPTQEDNDPLAAGKTKDSTVWQRV